MTPTKSESIKTNGNLKHEKKKKNKERNANFDNVFGYLWSFHGVMLRKINLKLVRFVSVESSWSSMHFYDPPFYQNQLPINRRIRWRSNPNFSKVKIDIINLQEVDKEKNSLNHLFGYQEKFEPCSFHHLRLKYTFYIILPF